MKHFRNIFITKKEVTYKVTIILSDDNARISKELYFNSKREAFDYWDNIAELSSNYIDGFITIVR